MSKQRLFSALWKRALLGIFFILNQFSPVLGVELLDNDRIIIPDKVSPSHPITIDGELDEATWKLQPIANEFRTIFPHFGSPMPQETLVWAAFDSKNIYFAFQCFDSESYKIKTSITQRDNISQDDQVGILLDAVGNRQTNYEFYVNPNGIQADASNSAVSVNGSDLAPDFVWESAGKITAAGYQVEIRIPLESIRYQAGAEVKMGIIFLRQISRLGIKGTWPEVRRGHTTYSFMATMIYKDLQGPLVLEVLPNVTYNRTRQRQESKKWSGETAGNIGAAFKLGITSSITVEATVNPDFSQVESDAFQLEVNQRYPVFYSEKRPFFMESKEILDFSIVKWGMMVAPIHTRLIIDPRWAAKFSGSSGRLNFALLAAQDRSPGQDWTDEVNPNEGKSAFFGIVRAKYSLGKDHSLGILYSGRYFAGERNDAVGADLKFQLTKNLRTTLSGLYSNTRAAPDASLKKGYGWNGMLQYYSNTFFSYISYERYDKDFYMATAHLNRTGINRWVAATGPLFKLKIKSLPWMKQINPYIYYINLHDLETKMDDRTWLFGLEFGFAPMGYVYFEYTSENEGWAGKLFHKNYLYGNGSIQLFKWLRLAGYMTVGDAVYYDPQAPLPGNVRTFNLNVTLQPSIKLNLGLEYVYSGLFHKGSKQKFYEENLYNFRTTYQFNKHFFVRGILRYNSFQEKLLTDLLASFTLIPGTVVHLGYGSVYQRNQWDDTTQQWVRGQGDLLQMQHGLFFKASYLWRIK